MLRTFVIRAPAIRKSLRSLRSHSFFAHLRCPVKSSENRKLAFCFLLLFRSLFAKLISHSPYGFDLVAAGAELCAQFFDMGINGAGISEIVEVPDIVQNVVAA